jgi:hypothetical protein
MWMLDPHSHSDIMNRMKTVQVTLDEDLIARWIAPPAD